MLYPDIPLGTILEQFPCSSNNDPPQMVQKTPKNTESLPKKSKVSHAAKPFRKKQPKPEILPPSLDLNQMAVLDDGGATNTDNKLGIYTEIKTTNNLGENKKTTSSPYHPLIHKIMFLFEFGIVW